MYLGGDGEHAVGGFHPSSGLFGDDCHDVHLVPVALCTLQSQRKKCDLNRGFCGSAAIVPGCANHGRSDRPDHQVGQEGIGQDDLG